MLTTDNKVYGVGSNFDGQLGFIKTTVKLQYPTLLDFGSNTVSAFSAGQKFSLIVLNNDITYASGSNAVKIY